MKPIRVFTLILFISIASNTFAFPSAGPCVKSQFEKLSDLVQKTRVFGTDDRKTFAEYAAQQGKPVSTIERKFAATGVLDCDTSQVTAQLTESNSVITASRHFFLDDKCAAEQGRKTCAFYVHDGTGWNVGYEVDMSSMKTGPCTPGSNRGDWAVLKLTKPVKGVRPYKVAKADSINGALEVINPAAFSMDFKVGDDYPRSINNCTILRIDSLAETTCDTGHGASGSANLREKDGDLFIVAVTLGSSYHNGKEMNVSTPMNGAFYEAVMSAAGEKNNTASAQSKDSGI